MAVSISRSPLVQVAIAAFIGVVAPEVADLLSDGYQSEDLSALNVIIGGGLAAAVRAAFLLIPARA